MAQTSMLDGGVEGSVVVSWGVVVGVVEGVVSGVVSGVVTGVAGGEVTAGPPVDDGFDSLAGDDDGAGPPDDDDDALAVTGATDWVDLSTAGEPVSGGASPGGTAAVENSPAMVVEGPESIGRLVSIWDVVERLAPDARTTAKATTTRVATTIPGSSSRHRAVHQSPSEASHSAGVPP